MNEEMMKELILKIMKELDFNKDSSILEASPDEKVQTGAFDDSFQVEVSARHIHLSKEHLESLFKDQEIGIKKELSQPGQYQADIRVTLIGPKGVLQNIAVLGPSRNNTQIELSLTDARVLGINPPVRDSGDTKGSAGVIISANGRAIELTEGVIIAKRHIHMTPKDAVLRGVKDKDLVKVRVEGDRPLIFDDVLVRVSDKYSLAMHIDFDEANAVGHRPDSRGRIVFDSERIKLENKPLSKEETSSELKECFIEKKLISEEMIKELVKSEPKIVNIPKASILTPLAVDFIKEKRIELKRV